MIFTLKRRLDTPSPFTGSSESLQRFSGATSVYRSLQDRLRLAVTHNDIPGIDEVRIIAKRDARIHNNRAHYAKHQKMKHFFLLHSSGSRFFGTAAYCTSTINVRSVIHDFGIVNRLPHIFVSRGGELNPILVKLCR